MLSQISIHEKIERVTNDILALAKTILNGIFGRLVVAIKTISKKFNYSIDRIDIGLGVSICAIPHKNIFFISSDGRGGFTQYCEIEELDRLIDELTQLIQGRLYSVLLRFGERKLILEVDNDIKKADIIYQYLLEEFPTISRAQFKAVNVRSYNILF